MKFRKFPAAALTAMLLMLIAMTFNVGLFVAVVAGLALGVLLFSEDSSISLSPGLCCDVN